MSYSDREDFFTKHLFGAGIACPTKLYYYSKGYPQSKRALPFIEHAEYNKRLLEALLESLYSDGKFIEEPTVKKAADRTNYFLQQKNVVIFDAVFEHQQMMARLPVIVKEGKDLTVYHIRTKAFDSRKHRLANAKGQIYSKWRKYLIDFAYQLYLIKKNWPKLHIQPFLVMPEKAGSAHTDNLPLLLNPLEGQKSLTSISDSNQELLAKLDVTELISEVWQDPTFAHRHFPRKSFEESLLYLKKLYFDQLKEDPAIGLKCKSCEYRVEKERVEAGTKSGFIECWRPKMDKKDLLESHVFDLIGSGTPHWMQHEIYNQKDVPVEEFFLPDSILEDGGKLTQQMRQALQVYKARGEEVPREIFRSQLFQELQRWEYPLHFLDFEAGNYAVPVRKNRSPYDLVIFQFSCHTLYREGNWSHYQWIDDSNNDYVSYELVRQLMKVPEIERGTIVQYSDFERNALKNIRRELLNEDEMIPDSDLLISWIESIIHRNDSYVDGAPYMADLSRQVRNFYYNHKMEDSLSIKDVLRSIMSLSDVLKEEYSRPYSSQNFDKIQWWQYDGKEGARNPYEILTETGDSPIHRGTEAMVVYGKLIAQQLPPEKRKAYKKALLKYCELDTLAMLMIYQHWHKKMHEKLKNS